MIEKMKSNLNAVMWLTALNTFVLLVILISLISTPPRMLEPRLKV